MQLTCLTIQTGLCGQSKTLTLCPTWCKNSPSLGCLPSCLVLQDLQGLQSCDWMLLVAFTVYLDDLNIHMCALFALAVAAAESAVGDSFMCEGPVQGLVRSSCEQDYTCVCPCLTSTHSYSFPGSDSQIQTLLSRLQVASKDPV